MKPQENNRKKTKQTETASLPVLRHPRPPPRPCPLPGRPPPGWGHTPGSTGERGGRGAGRRESRAPPTSGGKPSPGTLVESGLTPLQEEEKKHFETIIFILLGKPNWIWSAIFSFALKSIRNPQWHHLLIIRNFLQLELKLPPFTSSSTLIFKSKKIPSGFIPLMVWLPYRQLVCESHFAAVPLSYLG